LGKISRIGCESREATRKQTEKKSRARERRWHPRKRGTLGCKPAADYIRGGGASYRLLVCEKGVRLPSKKSEGIVGKWGSRNIKATVSQRQEEDELAVRGSEERRICPHGRQGRARDHSLSEAEQRCTSPPAQGLGKSKNPEGGDKSKGRKL